MPLEPPADDGGGGGGFFQSGGVAVFAGVGVTVLGVLVVAVIGVYVFCRKSRNLEDDDMADLADLAEPLPSATGSGPHKDSGFGSGAGAKDAIASMSTITILTDPTNHLDSGSGSGSGPNSGLGHATVHVQPAQAVQLVHLPSFRQSATLTHANLAQLHAGDHHHVLAEAHILGLREQLSQGLTNCTSGSTATFTNEDIDLALERGLIDAATAAKLRAERLSTRSSSGGGASVVTLSFPTLSGGDGSPSSITPSPAVTAAVWPITSSPSPATTPTRSIPNVSSSGCSPAGGTTPSSTMASSPLTPPGALAPSPFMCALAASTSLGTPTKQSSPQLTPQQSPYSPPPVGLNRSPTVSHHQHRSPSSPRLDLSPSASVASTLSLSPSANLAMAMSPSLGGGVRDAMSAAHSQSHNSTPSLSPTQSLAVTNSLQPYGSGLGLSAANSLQQTGSGLVALSPSGSVQRGTSSWTLGGAEQVDLQTIQHYCTVREDTYGEQQRVGPGAEAPLSRPSRTLMLLYSQVAGLAPGSIFYSKYKIKGSPILGRHSVVMLAKNIYSRQRVAIKFFTQHDQFEREKHALRQLSSGFVPALEEPIEGYEDYPPALVMERGKQTLTDWLKTQHPDSMLQRTALHQIVGALVHLHSHKLVHRDLKPSNIMWFEECHRFKLIDLAETCHSGETAPLTVTPLYSCPELLKAAVQGEDSVAVTCAADMFSFGIICYEVLTGCRYYGANPLTREVLEAVFGYRPLPSEGDATLLNGVELAQARRLILNLLQRNPGSRWSAATCYRNALFDSAEDTDQKAEALGKILSKISEVSQLVQASTAEMHAASIAINFTICEWSQEEDHNALPAMQTPNDRGSGSSGGPPKLRHSSSLAQKASFRKGSMLRAASMGMATKWSLKEVPMYQDDCLNDPIFMLLLNQPYQIRITMAHNKGLDLKLDYISYLRVITPDGETQTLPVRVESQEDDKVMAVVDWDPSMSRSKLLNQPTPSEGPLARRVVCLAAELCFVLRSMTDPIKVSANLYLAFDRKSWRYKVAKLKMWSADRWSQAPQWVRDVAKGALVLVRVAGGTLNN